MGGELRYGSDDMNTGKTASETGRGVDAIDVVHQIGQLPVELTAIMNPSRMGRAASGNPVSR